MKLISPHFITIAVNNQSVGTAKRQGVGTAVSETNFTKDLSAVAVQKPIGQITLIGGCALGIGENRLSGLSRKRVSIYLPNGLISPEIMSPIWMSRPSGSPPCATSLPSLMPSLSVSGLLRSVPINNFSIIYKVICIRVYI